MVSGSAETTKNGNITPLTMDLVVTSLSAPQSCLFPMQHTNKWMGESQDEDQKRKEGSIEYSLCRTRRMVHCDERDLCVCRRRIPCTKRAKSLTTTWFKSVRRITTKSGRSAPGVICYKLNPTCRICGTNVRTSPASPKTEFYQARPEQL